MATIDSLLQTLASCPQHSHSQIDACITEKLSKLIGQSASVQADSLKDILDECAHYSLASDFAMQAMDIVWKMAIEESKNA